MNKILACIDTRGNADAVIDWSAWAALRMQLPLEFLHVLERHPEVATVSDFSGTIGVDARESLLKELSDQDEARSIALREAGRLLLAQARGRAAQAGVQRLDARLRHGDFVQTAIELQSEAELLVLGEHHRAPTSPRMRSDHHLEPVIRGVSTSILVATTQAFVAPKKVIFGFDGSVGASQSLARMARHPLLTGLPVLVAMAAPDVPRANQQLREAQAGLQAARVVVETLRMDGEPDQVLPALIRRETPALLVIGAFGHSRWRQILLGSTTRSLLRFSDVPVLILR